MVGGGSVHVEGNVLYEDDGGDNWAERRVFSLGGGTGTATGSDDSESLFTNNTFIGPDSLFKCIWYFLFKTYKTAISTNYECIIWLDKFNIIATTIYAIQTAMTNINVTFAINILL